jgi:hypothetical protein
MAQVRPEAWEAWHRFALERLEYGHDEAVEYATARYVEDQNLARLREAASRAAEPPPGLTAA